MANRFWVGGTASWDATAGTKWATTSGGAGGAAVPTSADDVFFDAASGAVTVTMAIDALGGFNNLDCTGFTGTLNTTAGVCNVYGSLTFGAGMTLISGGWAFFGAGTQTIISNGKNIGGMTIGSISFAPTVSLADALTAGNITVTRGTFTTNNFSVTATSLSSSNTNTRTINLGSSTVTLSSLSALTFTTATNLTFNAGTSLISCSGADVSFAGGSQTFYNLRFTFSSIGTASISGQNTFNDVLFAGRTSAGVTSVQLLADQTINGTLTLSAGTNATMRTFVRSNTIGTTRTLTCAAVASLTDIDFRDITIAGAAAPVSGTRLGDCKGNSGITFDAPKTVYVVATNTTQWSNNIWAASIGGVANAVNFPLAQDTAVIPSANPTSGQTVTVNASYNIGTINMSARTSNTMTLATGTTTPAIYGNWINGTGTTLSGTGAITFAGRGSQTITSAGKSFSQNITFESPGGDVALMDALSIPALLLRLNAGSFTTNNYAVTVPAIQSATSVTGKQFNLGSSTLTLTTNGVVWSFSGGLTVTGTGTISLTSTTAKTFAGGGIQTYPTLNQGGTGALTISGSNGFRSMTNTAVGSVLFTGGTTNTFSVSFSLNGALANLLTLGSTNTTQAILKKPTSWQMGLTSMDMGNNTGLTFLSSDGTMSYLSVSYINGQLSALPYMGNFFAFF